MEVLKEFLFIIGILAIAYILASLILWAYWGWKQRKNERISEAYRKAVEKHNLYEGTPDFVREGLLEIERNKAKRSYIPTGKDADRSQAFSHASSYDGMEISAAQIIMGTSDIFNPAPTHTTFSGESFWRGGDFGGGEASGSWDSGSDSSSSSYSSDVSDSGNVNFD